MLLGDIKLELVVTLCRVEKERNSMRSEVEDLQSQVEHVNKGKVQHSRL